MRGSLPAAAPRDTQTTRSDHPARCEAVDEREKGPSVVVETEAAGEEHDFDEVIHGSARPRCRLSKCLRRTGWLSRQALESMRSWFILGLFGIRGQGSCNQG